MEWLEAEGCCEALRNWYEAVERSLKPSPRKRGEGGEGWQARAG